MPSFCMVVGCGSRGERDKHLSFFRLPSIYTRGKKVCELSAQRRAKWIEALKRADLTETKLKFGRICSKHFHSGKPASLQDVINPDWVPTKDMGYTSCLKVKDVERHHRYKKRLERVDRDESISEHEIADQPLLEHAEPTYEELKQELQQARQEIERLKNELKKYHLVEDYFKENEEDIPYYTGFTGYVHFKSVLSAIVPYLRERNSLTKFQQLLLTMMKLRLNFDFTYLGKKFDCHRTTASRVFENTIEVLYYRFKNFVYWPLRTELQTNIPPAFKQIFGSKLTVIIDCFEVFIQKPSNLEAASKTWSNYKHHHTMKFLIGISPQGFIMYISQAYGGRASDKFITENSGFLNNLLPGDLVIADRGFSIDDAVRLYCAEVQYPAFLRGKSQLGPMDVEKTRKLASVRIHVERVIGTLKGKFRILHETFPLVQLQKADDQFAFVDKIVIVCAAIINLCPSIISLE